MNFVTASALVIVILSNNASWARSSAEVRTFRQAQPCPSTGQFRGACPGYQVDHIRPLCAGGEDKPTNMHWLAVEDHRFKTLVDVRECRKLRRGASQPAAEPSAPLHTR